MLSVADVGWGSVIGNTLDHGVTYMPYGVDMGMQCGMEVVLASGEVMRTGMGAMPENRSWHVYKRGGSECRVRDRSRDTVLAVVAGTGAVAYRPAFQLGSRY